MRLPQRLRAPEEKILRACGVGLWGSPPAGLLLLLRVPGTVPEGLCLAILYHLAADPKTKLAGPTPAESGEAALS